MNESNNMTECNNNMTECNNNMTECNNNMTECNNNMTECNNNMTECNNMNDSTMDSNKLSNIRYEKYEKIRVPSDYVNIVIGREFVNINNIKSLSPEVSVLFISDRLNNKNKFIVKSNNVFEFDRVIFNIKNLINDSYVIYCDIKKKKKEQRKLNKKLREIKVRKELTRKIENELMEKENARNNPDILINEKKKKVKMQYNKNPFFGLEIDNDTDTDEDN